MKEKQLKEQSEQRKLLAVGKTKLGKPSTKGKKKFVSGKGKKNKDGILDSYGKPGKVYSTFAFRITFLAHFQKMKVGLSAQQSVCLCVCLSVFLSLITFEPLGRFS
jgi:hypothetical protein